MKRFFVYGIIIMFLGTISACSIAKEEQIQSTEGLVLEETIYIDPNSIFGIFLKYLYLPIWLDGLYDI